MCKQPSVVPGFRCSDDVGLREFGTKQIHQGLRASMMASAYASKHGCIKELVTFLFCDRMARIRLVNWGQCYQLEVELEEDRDRF